MAKKNNVQQIKIDIFSKLHFTVRFEKGKIPVAHLASNEKPQMRGRCYEVHSTCIDSVLFRVNPGGPCRPYFFPTPTRHPIVAVVKSSEGLGYRNIETAEILGKDNKNHRFDLFSSSAI